jgi:hypothetical protein
MADNYTALARGFNAVSWNPAMLAQPENPRFSMAMFPVRGNAGFGPITLADVSDQSGIFLTDVVKEDWLRRIAEHGGEHGTAGGDITYFAMSIGHFGFQLASASQVTATLSPDAAELLLFGNGYRSTDTDFDLANSSFRGMVTTTAAMSFAQELPIRFLLPVADQHLSVGVTVKYTVGNALIQGQNVGSSVSGGTGDLDVAFPVVQSDTAADAGSFDRGRGFGLDVGAAWRGGPLSLGVAFQNIYNSFAWDTAGFHYRPGTVRFDGVNREAEFDVEAYGNAPDAMKREIAEFRFQPRLVVGAAWQVNRAVLLSADVRHEIGEKARELGPRSHIGAGAELRWIPAVPLRAGFAVITGGYQIGAGAGVELGGVNLSGSVGQRTTDFGHDRMIALGLTFGAR